MTNFRGISIPAASSGGGSGSTSKLVQVVNLQDNTVSSLTATIPIDGSIPQSGEGTQVMSLAITPTNAANKLKITVVYNFSPNGNYQSVCALFQDATANALAASPARVLSAGSGIITFVYYMTAGTTSATTFKVRAGPQVGGGTDTYNGVAGASIVGAVNYSSITIEEILA